MEELDCMRVIDEALRSVEDDGARSRVVGWISAKFVGIVPGNPRADSAYLGNGIDERADEIPGIAKLSQTGELQLTVRDFKARSANDAAVRLTHVLIRSAKKLTGESAVSSKNVIVPWLRKYRCYDGNTRSALARDKGLVREGDLLSLDFHAEQYADKVISEILESATEGKWKPTAGKRRPARFAHNTAEVQ